MRERMFTMILAICALFNFNAVAAAPNVQPKSSATHLETQNSVTLETQLSILIVPGSDSSKFLKMIPFVTAPDETTLMGESSVVPAKIATVELKPLVIEHPKKGSYVVGVFISLDASSEPLESSTFGFNGAVTAKVGNQVEYALIPSSLVGAPMLNAPNAKVTISTNIELPVGSEAVLKR